MARAFPDAPIYTSVYLPEHTFDEFAQLNIVTLPYSKFIRNEKQFKRFYPLWLYLIRRIDFREFDIVLTSSTYLAKFIRPAAEVKHFCYLYAPFRYVWHPESYHESSLPFSGIFKIIAEKIAFQFRNFDLASTKRIEKIATSCINMANEIRDIYGVDARIIYPPIQMAEFGESDEKEDYYLVVSRLISHKRIDVAVEAFNCMGKPLVVIGDGPEKTNLEKKANENITFTGVLDDDQVQLYYRKTKGLVFPSNEDFGIVPLEAQACGTPVIAFGNGGVLETVKEGVSGLFFAEQTADSLTAAVGKFEKTTFDSSKIMEWAAHFSGDEFIKRFRKFVMD
jgi:glycosyltransferase involved in cell wall biosynthesis